MIHYCYIYEDYLKERETQNKTLYGNDFFNFSTYSSSTLIHLYKRCWSLPLYLFCTLSESRSLRYCSTFAITSSLLLNFLLAWVLGISGKSYDKQADWGTTWNSNSFSFSRTKGLVYDDALSWLYNMFLRTIVGLFSAMEIFTLQGSR